MNNLMFTVNKIFGSLKPEKLGDAVSVRITGIGRAVAKGIKGGIKYSATKYPTGHTHVTFDFPPKR